MSNFFATRDQPMCGAVCARVCLCVSRGARALYGIELSGTYRTERPAHGRYTTDHEYTINYQSINIYISENREAVVK